ncbi:MAG: hypothetical protein JO316_09230 [Abitibacteriaceae bacterium]|nr:hypothetical protein [Abditibacteriaceae bacterium]
MEATPPFRTVLLQGEVFDHWRSFKETHQMHPFDFVADIQMRRKATL